MRTTLGIKDYANPLEKWSKWEKIGFMILGVIGLVAIISTIALSYVA